jgi:hypothetical protein
LIKVLKIAHLLSLDVVLGAICCNVMFWKLSVSDAQLPIPIVSILGFSVWIVYILDRILDNQKIENSLSERHSFHQKYANYLWILIGIFTLICIVLLFFIPLKITLFGILTLSLTAIYLFVISEIQLKNPLQILKEPITAIVYTSGVFGTTILQDFSVINLGIGFIFLIIVFQNLLLFSLSEIKQNPSIYNLASRWGISFSNKFILFLSVTVLILGLFFFNIASNQYQSKVIICEILMSFILLIINQLDHFFLINDRYRWVGDGIFLLPLLIIF